MKGLNLEMNATERREEIINMLKSSSSAISATVIAKNLSVSRQIIVGDVALLRASGERIISTTRGYILENDKLNKDYIVKTIACIHAKKCIEDELTIIIDEGAKVLNVIVEHGVYGEIKGELHLSSRRDIKEFMEKLEKYNIDPLCQLTKGVHLHTICCKNNEIFETILKKLRKKGYLL
ncbi:transcription repressor NadR [Clostridium tarantellae]|nr:transcription repressor NadR [Clostridium tarantellae]